MQVTNGRRLIQLVYSSAAKGNEISNSESLMSAEEWEQFELFASEKPETMIFAEPDRLGFDGIVQIVAAGHPRRIFDLRQVPFISFGNETRESFLRVLAKNRVEYFNIFKLRNKLGNKPADEESQEDKYLSFEPKEVEKILKPMIKTGPTVVFSDGTPSQDKTIQRFLDLLSQAEISYSPFYAHDVELA